MLAQTVLTVAAVSLLWATPASACDCASDETTAETVSRVDFAFIGSVKSESADREQKYGLIYEIEVANDVKGNLADVIYARADSEESSCWFGWEAGDAVAGGGSADEAGRLSIGACTLLSESDLVEYSQNNAPPGVDSAELLTGRKPGFLTGIEPAPNLGLFGVVGVAIAGGAAAIFVLTKRSDAPDSA